MSGSIYGNIFKISTWGESHGKALGVVIDGCPAGLSLCESDIQQYLNRRKPGQSKFSTPRKEEDCVQLLSGVFDGCTTGAPISLLVPNENQRSKDYGDIANYYRPGHADYTFDAKYGFRDYKGGGRSSGRETIGRVAAGAIALKILEQLHIEIITYTKSIGPISIHPKEMDYNAISTNALYMPNTETAKEASKYLEMCMENHNSAGGMIECIVKKLPAGIGDPVFEKLDANLAKAIMSIGAVKSVEIGDGILVKDTTGLENNDAFYYDPQGAVQKKSNHAGGILGGISDGSDLLIKAAIKPTPSIALTQDTIHQNGSNIQINVKGRHDPIIVPRAVVVVEAMVAITLVDAMFHNMSAQMDHLLTFYTRPSMEEL